MNLGGNSLMKKKIDNLTLKEIKKVCRSFDDKGCKECPLKIICDDLQLYYITQTNMNKVVEIDE